MAKEEPTDREHYDHRWQFYPHEHPAAYWLRASGTEILCTRCGGRFAAGRDFDLGEEPAPKAEAFLVKHLACQLGHGVGGPGRASRVTVHPGDPIFEFQAA